MPSKTLSQIKREFFINALGISGVGMSNADLEAAFFSNPVSSGAVTIAALPATSVLAAENTTTRPTSRTDVNVIFLVAADPGANAQDYDIWIRQ